MSYSIIPVLHHYQNKDGMIKIYLQVICNRIMVRVSTPYRVKAEQFENGAVIDHPNKTAINGNIRKESNGIEQRLIDFLRDGPPTKKELEAIANNAADDAAPAIKLVDFITRHSNEMKGKKADGTLAVYESLIPDLNEYDASLTFDKIDISWLNLYEKWQRGKGWDINTIHKKMSKIKSMLNFAADPGFIEEKKFKKYVVPLYVQKIPEYISEIEMQAIKDLCDKMKNPIYKMAGYYFLLACYAGYRLSDLKKFDHAKSVKDDSILLRAKKNKAIVLMPLHTRLREVLAYVKDNPLTIVEQNMRDYVREIMRMCGINRHIKIHTARHSFAMMLMDNGFDLEEVATLLGVSVKTAAIYGHISNTRLKNKVKSKLG